MATMLVEPFAPWLRDLSQALQGQQSGAATFLPPADVLVDENGVSVYLDVPGLRAEDLEIELENDMLTIRGERPFPYPREQRGSGPIQRIERRFGRFERSLRVPQGLDPNAIEATLSDGVLKLRIPIPETQKPRKIEIRADADGGERQQVIEGGEASGERQRASEGSAPSGERERASERSAPSGERQQAGVGS